MSSRLWFPLIMLCFMVMIPDRACPEETVLPKGAEELYGTWVNEKNLADVFHGQKVVVTAEGMKIFCKASDTDPRMVTSWEITAKWKDSEGNVWYKTREVSTGGIYQGAKWQSLLKINKSGTAWERATIMLELGSFNPAFYPKAIDPKGTYYRVLYRTGK